MMTIRNTLRQFLAETGDGNPRSMSSPASIIDLFSRYLDDYGHEDLNKFERARFDKEWRDDHRFCDIFGPDHIQPFHINYFLSTFVIRKVMGTKGFLKACGPVMEKLSLWLLKQGYWSPETMEHYREIAGEDPGRELVACRAFSEALQDYLEKHPPPEANADIDEDEYYEDQFTIKSVLPEKLIFEGLLEENEDIVISLPKPVTNKAKTGWSVTMELARIKGRWRILGVGNVYP